jgi:twinkle protein
VLIPKELVNEAKEKMGVDAARLIAEELNLKDFDDKNLKSICPFHIEDTPSFVWNEKENCWHCFGECGMNYGIIDHYMQHHSMTYIDAVKKLFEETRTPFLFGEKGVRVDRDYKYPVREDCGSREQVETYLNLRKITIPTLDYADIRQDQHGNIVFHYYDTNDVLTAVKYRPARKVDKRDKMPKYWAQKDADNDAGTLFLGNKANPTKPLVITEGEIDALSVYESGWKNVVSIPFGAGKNKDNWIEKNYEWLEQFSSIIIWFDNDGAGIQSRKEACARLGTWKTRFVNLPSIVVKDGITIGIKDANEVLFHLGSKAVLDYILDAEEVPVPNVSDLADVEDFDIETAPGLKTSLKGLNDVVYKFFYGSLIILTGKKGHGKSVLLNQIFVCDALEAGEDVFIYSGELGTSLLKNWIETPLIGRENIIMKDEFVRSYNPEAKKEMREWYRGRIWAYDDIDNNSDKILDRAVNITRKFGAKVWIIDNLMSLDIGITGEGNQWTKQKDFVVKLVSLALTYGVLIVLVGHPRKVGSNSIEIARRITVDDVAGSGDIGNIAHMIMSVHRFSKEEKAGKIDKRNGGYIDGQEPIGHDVAIDVLKNRFTGKVDEIRAYFDYPSYRFYSSVKELWKRYGWNKSTEPLRSDDPNKHGVEMPDGFGE